MKYKEVNTPRGERVQRESSCQEAEYVGPHRYCACSAATPHISVHVSPFYSQMCWTSLQDKVVPAGAESTVRLIPPPLSKSTIPMKRLPELLDFF